MTMNTAWPEGLDPQDPDSTFVDGDHEYAVRVAPATFPTAFLFGSGTAVTLGEVIFTFALGVIAKWGDRRWKVAVLRAPLKKPAFWHAIDLEYVAVDEAEPRQLEILRSWDSRHRSTQPAIPLNEVRRLRRATRR